MAFAFYATIVFFKSVSSFFFQTIIFIRYYSKAGHEISGYIDYRNRLLNEDWVPFFMGDRKLRVRTTDLVFFNWRNKKSSRNHSPNYWVRTLPYLESSR